MKTGLSHLDAASDHRSFSARYESVGDGRTGLDHLNDLNERSC